MTDLARRVVLSKSGLTNVIDRLEKRGFLRRMPDPTERRATRITLTDDGRTAFIDAADVHVAGIKKHVADRLTDAAAKVIVKALTRIRGEIEA